MPSFTLMASFLLSLLALTPWAYAKKTKIHSSHSLTISPSSPNTHHHHFHDRSFPSFILHFSSIFTLSLPSTNPNPNSHKLTKVAFSTTLCARYLFVPHAAHTNIRHPLAIGCLPDNVPFPFTFSTDDKPTASTARTTF